MGDWFRLVIAGVLACVVTQSLGHAATPAGDSKVLSAARARGEIAIGVKADVPPFGSRNAEGEAVGFEPDLAQRVADGLGLKLRKVVVTTENRFQRLEEGAIDVLMATSADTRERRALAAAVEPGYYPTGVTVMLRGSEQIASWKQLAGRSLCALQGAYFNEAIRQQHLVDLQLYRSPRDALLALRDGRCVGYLYTDLVIHHLIRTPQWSDYKAPLESNIKSQWVMFLQRAEAGGALERMLGDMVADWHRKGTLIELERTWNITPAARLATMREPWLARSDDGRYVCERLANGQWPSTCVDSTYATPSQGAGAEGLGLLVRDTLGVDLSIIYDPNDRTRFLRAVATTAFLCTSAIGFAIAWGFALARLALSRLRLLARLSRAIAMVGRSTPMLLQMYFLMFGVGSYLAMQHRITIPPMLVAVVSIGIYHGCLIAYTLTQASEVLRHREPTFHLKLSTLHRVIALSSAGVRGTLTNLTKASAIASAIAVPELLTAATAISADRGNSLTMMNLLLVIFYVITTAWIFLFARAERWLGSTRATITE